MDRGGSALLTVLWLTAALSTIAFSLASSVRGETERTAAALDGVRSYYLAAGAIERALLYIQWGPIYRQQDGSSRYYTSGVPVLNFTFSSGEAVVEVIPEAAKMNINFAPPEDLYRLLVNLGAEPERAREIALGIVDWRSPVARPGSTPFDQYYLSLVPSFSSRHASFEEIEEVLLIKGMTPELFHGTYEPDPQGRLLPRGGLKDCITVYGAVGQYDVNTAEPAVLTTAGLSPDLVAAIVETRRSMPFRDQGQLAGLLGGAGGALQKLRVGGNTIYTLRATARLRVAGGGLSDQRSSVAAVVKLNPYGYPEPYHVLRWYDHVWTR